MRLKFYFTTNVFAFLLFAGMFLTNFAYGQRKMENLGRGVVAARTTAAEVYVGWRLLATDPEGVKFNVYRDDELITPEPIAATNIIDKTRDNGKYAVHAVVNGEVQKAPAAVEVWANPYLTIPLQVPAGGTTPDGVNYTYSPNDASVGDLDGDGEYEIVVKWDPSNSKDNSQGGYTGNVYIDAYEFDGTHLWRIDLGRNIRAGAHYTQFIVYDLDSDGKAEVAMKTADGTIDGVGTVIGDANADFRNGEGRILSGPEFLTVFSGETGEALATTNYIPARGSVGSWGDNYGNRVDRFLAGVGYFDGESPSLVMARGYYTRTVIVAWDWRNGQLTERWTFDTNDPGNGAYAGQGYHSLSIADLDEDGKDEVFYGSMAVDHDGTGLWNTGLGHGDAHHVTDLDPTRPGLESWTAHESPSQYQGNGLWFRDAKTGEKLWGVETTGDIGRNMAADIDPAYPGYEVWGARGGLYSAKGELISTNRPGSMSFGVWWDGDLHRELLGSTKIEKWNPSTTSLSTVLDITRYNANTNNGTKANPALSADILGDWREEVIFRTNDNANLILFSPVFPSQYSLYTLMHDPMYRVAIAWQNVGYNQPPYPSYYLGTGMDTENPPKSEIAVVGEGPALVDAPVRTSVGDELGRNIRVFPNPSTGQFFVEVPGSFSYTISDQLGRVLESGKGVNAKSVGGKLAPGMYILKVDLKKESRASWIIKK